MKTICILILALALSSCAHNKETTSADAKKALVGQYEDRIGKATKEDLIEDFGNPSGVGPRRKPVTKPAASTARKTRSGWARRKTASIMRLTIRFSRTSIRAAC